MTHCTEQHLPQAGDGLDGEGHEACQGGTA